jgi:hypothetical protein
VNLLKELETFESEDAPHQYAVEGGPPVELSADDDVVSTAHDDFLVFDLVFRDGLLQDVGDEVDVSTIFSLRHEDVAAARRGHVASLHHEDVAAARRGHVAR